MNVKNIGLFIILLNVLILLSSCNKSDEETPKSMEVELNFLLTHFVDAEELYFNTMQYTNAFGNLYSIETLKYFISDITLYKMNGDSLLIDEEHYVDAAEESTLSFIPGLKIPVGEYSSISFIFGLNEAKNVNGRYLNPPENNMEWPLAMGPGYHYMKLEGKHDSTGVIKNFQAHTGATMGNQNYIRVNLPSSDFKASGAKKTITIKMNINNWWANPYTFDLNMMTMVMGNQPVQEMLHDNGADVFSIVSIE
ncbi:MAG: hypothetical protein K9G76_04490 [Bacteroidales bacterium]|nr:hypothetical protein [Bacteroidales bacterium]MCF8403683.1 hypothetical protein [Bacteroidales bacterium]